MALPVSYFSLSVNDNTLKANGTPESALSEVAITTMTPGNAAATVTAMGNLKTAIAGIIIGVLGKDNLIYQRDLLSSSPASSPLAQRENKWLCRYHDNTTHKKFNVSIGTADLTLLTGNSEFLDISAGAGGSFKTAFEALVVSPDDASHSVTLDSVQFVGRTS